jgi:hypothetical protein
MGMAFDPKKITYGLGERTSVAEADQEQKLEICQAAWAAAGCETRNGSSVDCRRRRSKSR